MKTTAMQIGVATHLAEMKSVMGKHILIADDDKSIRDTLRMWLETDDAQFTISEAKSGEDALKVLLGAADTRPDIVLLDHFLQDMEGTQVQQELLNHGIEIPVILITGRVNAKNTIESAQLGAVGYLIKPFENGDQVVNAVRKALHDAQLRHEDIVAEMPETDPTEKIIGRGAEMTEIFRTIGLVARSQSTILITGETGTGKTLLAETIHRSSDRRRMPFVTFNCAGVPETLLEAALFGSEKGSYTGADRLRIGYFETANKGTIFLDEIGEMTMTTQTKLLTVLQDKEIVRLGSSTPIKVDVRIIAATHKDLARAVQERRFREDLYYRLNVISIHMPALRSRQQDIPALVSHFLDIHRFSSTMPPARITTEGLAKLEHYDWPGNVRDLENVVTRAVLLSRGDLIMPEHIIFTRIFDNLVLNVSERVQAGTPLSTIVREAQMMAIRTALKLSDGHAARAAELLVMDIESFNAVRLELGM